MLFGAIIEWWIKQQAKRHPDKNTKKIIEEFLKENNLDVDVIINDNATGAFVPASEKKRLLKKLEKLPEHKKQEIIKKIEQSSGFNVEQIKSQIVTPSNIAVGLHEAGHAKDLSDDSRSAKRLALSHYSASAGDIIGGLTSLKNPKLGAAIMLAGKFPKLQQEYRASKTSYDTMKKVLGEEEAKKRAMKTLLPGFATYVLSGSIEPILISSIAGKVLKKKASEMLADFEKKASELSPEELEIYSQEVLSALLD